MSDLSVPSSLSFFPSGEGGGIETEEEEEEKRRNEATIVLRLEVNSNSCPATFNNEKRRGKEEKIA